MYMLHVCYHLPSEADPDASAEVSDAEGAAVGKPDVSLTMLVHQLISGMDVEACGKSEAPLLASPEASVSGVGVAASPEPSAAGAEGVGVPASLAPEASAPFSPAPEATSPAPAEVSSAPEASPLAAVSPAPAATSPESALGAPAMDIQIEINVPKIYM